MDAIRIAVLLVTLLAMAGCSSSVAGKAGALQTPTYPMKEYRIQPGDQLDVKFFYNPELNESLTVRSDGRITLQLVNDVVAAGLTPSQLTAVLTRAYAGELSSPKIAVIVKTSMADKVFVDGEVNRAGLIPLPSPTTVLQAIAQAGGMKETAKADSVILLRKSDDTGKITATRLNIERASNGSDPMQDVMLKPNDIVFVPKSGIANLNQWVDQYIRKNIPLPIGLGYSL
jgi:polysaccharide biosynthesis/export protein